ncbi:MAG: ABC transporter permease [Bacteroidota bacterium]
MLKNYFKIAIRNLLKQKLFSVINVLGLTAGMTCSILLYLYVNDELSFDQFNRDKDSIYRVIQDTRLPDGSLEWQGIFHSIPLGPVLKEEMPAVEDYVRFYKPHGEVGYYIKNGEKAIYSEVLYADYQLFDIFDFPIEKGFLNRNDHNSVMLSERAARKYFGEDDPLDQVLSFRIDDQYVDFTVSGVFRNIPSNSSVQFDVVLPFGAISRLDNMKNWLTDWRYGAIITYVKLKEGTNPQMLDDPMKGIMAKYYPQYEERALNRGYSSAEDYRYFRLEPLTDVHFNTAVFEGLVPASDPVYSYILIGLVVAILGIACFNFMNLSLSRSAYRIKEVGLRKTIGAKRSQLIRQFLGESVFLSFLAFALSLLLADLLLPAFNLLTNKQITLSALFSFQSIGILTLITLVVGVMAGFYPAFVISRFNIKETLAGVKHKAAGTLTKILIVLQFSIATILVFGMLVMNTQTNYLLNKNLGFDSDQVIELKNAKIGESSAYDHLKATLPGHSGIHSLTSANQSFGSPSGLGGLGFEYNGENKRVGMIQVTDNYLATMGINLVQGRKFITESQENAVIINEACAKDFELKSDEKFNQLTNSPTTDPVVVGVMGDFNYSSLKLEVFPMLIRKTMRKDLNYIFIKLSGVNTSGALKYIENQWDLVAPDLPFEYKFLSNTMQAQYESEERWGQIIFYSMAMTVLLSALGLLGIVALGLEAKKKEISIRKIFGAHVSNIIWLVSNSYVKLVVGAYLIAIPVAYKLSDVWLSGFAYKAELGVSVYLIAGVMIMAIALVTVASKTLNAAAQNPIKYLRNE